MSAQTDFEPATSEALSRLFIADTPLLDVRAPVEFQRGAFPTASNIPLLNDEERHQIGIRYKQAGQDAAIKLGHEMVSGDIKQQRRTAWSEFIAANPDARLYCFRGGQRSKIVQQWLQETGISINRIEGGYKKLRRFLIDNIDKAAAEQKLVIIAGKTGCGKTHLLDEVGLALDLEGRANHRGSAFGRRIEEQPSQIDFENQLSIDLLKLRQNSPKHIFVEDESRAVGSLSVPPVLFAAMRNSPLAVIEQPLEARIDVILNDYILANHTDFQQHYPDNHFQLFAEYLRQALGRIRRRLGDENFAAIDEAMESALREHEKEGVVAGHRIWIEHLLSQYYDPMYDYQLEKKLERLIFRGSQEEFLAWAKHLTATQEAES